MSTTPNPTPTPSSAPSTSQIANEILGIASIGLTTATAVLTGPAAGITTAVAGLVTIIQKAIAAHESVTGQPIDPALLKPFVPIE